MACVPQPQTCWGASAVRVHVLLPLVRRALHPPAPEMRAGRAPCDWSRHGGQRFEDYNDAIIRCRHHDALTTLSYRANAQRQTSVKHALFYTTTGDRTCQA